MGLRWVYIVCSGSLGWGSVLVGFRVYGVQSSWVGLAWVWGGQVVGLA